MESYLVSDQVSPHQVFHSWPPPFHPKREQLDKCILWTKHLYCLPFSQVVSWNPCWMSVATSHLFKATRRFRIWYDSALATGWPCFFLDCDSQLTELLSSTANGRIGVDTNTRWTRFPAIWLQAVKLTMMATYWTGSLRPNNTSSGRHACFSGSEPAASQAVLSAAMLIKQTMFHLTNKSWS